MRSYFPRGALLGPASGNMKVEGMLPKAFEEIRVRFSFVYPPKGFNSVCVTRAPSGARSSREPSTRPCRQQKHQQGTHPTGNQTQTTTHPGGKPGPRNQTGPPEVPTSGRARAIQCPSHLNKSLSDIDLPQGERRKTATLGLSLRI